MIPDSEPIYSLHRMTTGAAMPPDTAALGRKLLILFIFATKILTLRLEVA